MLSCLCLFAYIQTFQYSGNFFQMHMKWIQIYISRLIAVTQLLFLKNKDIWYKSFLYLGIFKLTCTCAVHTISEPKCAWFVWLIGFDLIKDWNIVSHCKNEFLHQAPPINWPYPILYELEVNGTWHRPACRCASEMIYYFSRTSFNLSTTFQFLTALTNKVVTEGVRGCCTLYTPTPHHRFAISL